MLARIVHALLIIVEDRLPLNRQRRSKCCNKLNRSTEKSGDKIDSKRQRKQCYKKSEQRERDRLFFFTRPPEAGKQICGKSCETAYPQEDKRVSRQDVPTISHVSDREELEREGQFEESESDLERGHPVARTREPLHGIGEHGKDREGQRQSKSKAKHTDSGSKQRVACRLNKERADDGTCAGERDNDKSERHEHNAQEA